MFTNKVKRSIVWVGKERIEDRELGLRSALLKVKEEWVYGSKKCMLILFWCTFNCFCPGPGFRLSETQPVRFIRQLEDWFPFLEEDDGFPGRHDAEKRSVNLCLYNLYRVCHGFRLLKLVDYFWVEFCQLLNWVSLSVSSENWLKPKTKPQ